MATEYEMILEGKLRQERAENERLKDALKCVMRNTSTANIETLRAAKENMRSAWIAAWVALEPSDPKLRCRTRECARERDKAMNTPIPSEHLGVGGVPNLAAAFLVSRGETVEDWDGVCGELADAVISPNDHIVHVEPACLWRFHMVPLIGGLVHDAWCAGPAIPINEWLIRLCGCDDVTVAIDGVDIYSGPANEFSLGGGGGSETSPRHDATENR